MDMKFFRDVWSLDCGEAQDKHTRIDRCQNACCTGGRSAEMSCACLCALLTASWTWTKQVDGGDAPQRNGHTAVLFTETAAAASGAASPSNSSGSMLVFGGSDADGPSDALWRYDLSSRHWSRVQTVGHPPEARELHAACMVTAPTTAEQWMVVSGGRGVGALLNTCYALRMPSSGGSNGGTGTAWEWNLVGQCPARCAHSMAPLTVPANSPTLLVLQSAVASAAATAATVAAAAAAAGAASDSASSSTPASASASASAAAAGAGCCVFSPSSASAIPLLLYGGTDGSLFYSDVLGFELEVARLEPSESAQGPPQPCPNCQGPPGWTILAEPERKQEQETATKEEAATSTAAPATTAAATESDPAATAAAAAASASKSKKRNKKKKNANSADVQPPTSFAHTLTALPCVSHAFAAAPVSSSDAVATATAPPAPPAPACFLLFGGMNDEADLDQTHFLEFAPFQA